MSRAGSVVPVADFSASLRHAIELAREAGLTQSAAALEERAFAVYTTSSERLGEVGAVIQEFRSREGERVPAQVDELLDHCLREVGAIWPKYNPGLLKALASALRRWWAE